MKVYTARHVARVLDLSVGRVRSYARSGLLQPDRGPRGEYRFSFSDLVLLRTAKGLMAARVPPRNIRKALERLKQRLPGEQSLTGVRMEAEGDHVVARHDGAIWNPETGQTRFDFEATRPSVKVALHTRTAAADPLDDEEGLSAEDWFSLGADLEAAAPDHALESYRRALDLDPEHFETRIGLGRLLRAQGRMHAAETHFRLALGSRPGDTIALLNLAVCLEDLGRVHEALRAYLDTLESDRECADAHYNVARLYEGLGDKAAALRHRRAYRRLTES